MASKKLDQAMVKFHNDKIQLIRKRMEDHRHAGERRIWKLQLELEEEIQHMENQIALHQKSIDEFNQS